MEVLDEIMTGDEGGDFKGRSEPGLILVVQFPYKLLKFEVRRMSRGLFCTLIGQGKQEDVRSHGVCFYKEAGDASLGQGLFLSGVEKE